MEPGAATVMRSLFESFAEQRAGGTDDREIEQLGYAYEGLVESGPRRNAGVHYTPAPLAATIVRHALDPLCFAPGLRPAAEILDLKVADIACGTGVFLLAAARYLAARVVEAWTAEGDPAARCADPLAAATRAVVANCLYGADIDETAVEMCRRSLWLLVADPQTPLNFLDRRILVGNSLLGLTDPRQLQTLHMDPTRGQDLTLPRDRRNRHEVADAMIAVGLAAGGIPGRALDAAYAELRNTVVAGDRTALDTILASVGNAPPHRRPLHWMLAAPEVVVERGGFDAVIGNPPFLGVKLIRGAIGQDLRDFLAHHVADGETGRADLVVLFLRRAAGLCRPDRGCIGLIATDSIGEGDSARFGLQALTDAGWTIARADRSVRWQGAGAGVRVSHLWLTRRQITGAVLDGVVVERIDHHLSARGTETTPRPAAIHAPTDLPPGYQASIVLGRTLILDANVAAELAREPGVAAHIKPYLSGDDVVGSVGAVASRQCLDVGALDEAELRALPELWRHLQTTVLPEREQQFARYPKLRARWWGYLSSVPRLYEQLDGLPWAVAFSKHSKHLWPVRVGVGHVFSNGLIVFPTADPGHFAFLASEFHRAWAIRAGGSMLNQAHRYNPSRLRATYPYPASFESLRPVGEALLKAVDMLTAGRGLGITDALNLVHDPAEDGADVRAVRECLTDLHAEGACLHGLSPGAGPSFVPSLLGTRFGLSVADEDAVMDALLRENARRAGG